MTPAEFIAKWQASTRNERSACQEHFIDLCHVLDEPTPNSDPTGEDYAFEKGATKFTGEDGWADVWRRNRFAWEYKKKRGDLNAAYRQLLLYGGPLGNPPLLVVSDIARIVIRTNFTNAVTETHEIALDELANPLRLRLLKHVFSDPEQLRPARTRQALTEQAAAEFAELARRLRVRGNDPQAVAHFVNRLVFCMFADDVGLLPEGLFQQMLALAKRRPARSAEYAGKLFGAMAKSGGEVGFIAVPWFDGGLFDDATALPLEVADIDLLISAAKLDWAEIDPSILGTLFERGLDPDKRSQLGAHYTDRAKIEMLIDPVIRRPLQAEWDAVREKIEVALAQPAARGRRARNGSDTPQALYHGFLERLRRFRVLDPACGSGNFLYLSLQALKDLEHQASVEAEALGLQREFPQVGPETMLGIEINQYAAELARVSVWIGHIQWTRKHGFAAPSDPVLQPLETIECRDAVLTKDGTVPEWPPADVVVGNPPFLGGKLMRRVMGDKYCNALFAAFAERVPAEADLVCYWFELAREQLANEKIKDAGLVATNSIRGGANREVLNRIRQTSVIHDAWSDEAWTVDGAAVRVSLVCFAEPAHATPALLNGHPVGEIFGDLTGRNGVDLTLAASLAENRGVAFMGDTKGGAFDVPGELARKWLEMPINANGRANSDVLRPWANGMDVVRRPSDSWIVDFGWKMSEADAAYYASPFAHVLASVRPVRSKNNRETYRRFWWRHVEPRPGMVANLARLTRFIVTPTVAKHRLFDWMRHPTLPDHQLIAIARDDDAGLGILHSRFHELWALRLGTWLGVGNDPRYTPSTTFETFPFPTGLTPNLPATSYADNPHAHAIAAAARDLVEKRDLWVNPPDLVERVPEVVPGFPDRIIPRNPKAAAILKTRTLTNLYNMRGTPEGTWLDNLHRALDEAVAAAYGWPADLSDDEILSRLLDLNRARAAAAGGRGARGSQDGQAPLRVDPSRPAA
ncbi:MAG TPA: class I SAM-dependent DNA methyltransferase [Acetobacteraceae bacterium]|jgi:type II restriction/modification system DNA methylase subunit YeeA|nr:class I SAM-dependent DNA methyltransferase [Acetobacteraceae bacterium]